MKTSTKLYLRIGFLCLIAVLDGMVDSCMGPALRDLQCIFNVTLQKVSLFQPAITAGRVIGALLFLKMPRRVDIYGVAAATMTMASCLLAVVPVLPSFWMALGLSGAVGLAHGASVHARIILSGELSKQHAATIHIINLATSAGSVTGPLIISPFLSDSVAQSNTRQAEQN
ncbi:uncharacterized protein LOC124272221 [Haliotis rubra]|uniref:uncharacterized protein LOC124272221 n=1 Tax=Haliotis rubra TaxID=36100 RepID=UPI001EE5223D|nr:uncharacterized protein LOC124272221 [Haliotis rubra]